MAVGALPPARLVAVRRAPRRLPRARPVRGCARGFLRSARACRPLRGGPPWWRSPAPGFGPPPGPWGRGAPLRRRRRLRWPRPVGACARPSLGSALPPAGPGGRRRAPPPPVRPAPVGRRGPLSAPGSPWCFRLAWPGGSPRAARRLRRRLRPRSSRAGARGSAPFPRPRALPRPGPAPPLPVLELSI